MPLERIAQALCSAPVGVSQALLSPECGGIPASPGLYSWWCPDDVLEIVPVVRPLERSDHRLLYVGIAPRSELSHATLRSRVIGSHLRGTTGRSTFRLSLAALLLDQLDLHPVMRGAKVLLSAEENSNLSTWMGRSLRVGWVVQEQPWRIERDVIVALKPPLNRALNSTHPFNADMRQRRAQFRYRAKP